MTIIISFSVAVDREPVVFPVPGIIGLREGEAGTGESQTAARERAGRIVTPRKTGRGHATGRRSL